MTKADRLSQNQMNFSRRNSFISLGVASLITVTIVVAMAQAPASKKLTAKDKVSINGIGPIHIGMPLTKAIDATQTEWQVGYSAEGSDCRYARPKKAISSLKFMVIGGVVVRVEVSSRGIATTNGVRVGDSEAQVKAAYPGKIKVEAHKYNHTGHYLIYTSAEPKDTKLRLVFETDGKVVTSYRAGRVPEVSWVEGCQ